MPGDVADRDHDAPVPERGRVVEVAADLERLAGRHVAPAQLGAQHVGQLARQQAALERERDVLHLARAIALAGRERVAQAGDLEVGVDAGEQLGAGERLDEVVVGPGFEALDRRLLARARRQHDHRQPLRARVLAQAGQQLEAVDVGHHHVGQDEVREPLGELRERVAPSTAVRTA